MLPAAKVRVEGWSVTVAGFASATRLTVVAATGGATSVTEPAIVPNPLAFSVMLAPLLSPLNVTSSTSGKGAR